MKTVILACEDIGVGSLTGSLVAKQSNRRCTSSIAGSTWEDWPTQDLTWSLFFPLHTFGNRSILLSCSKFLFAFLVFERQDSRCCASCCHESRQTSASSSSFFIWSLYCFVGPPWLRYPTLSSPKSTAFGMPVSSILAIWSDQSKFIWRMVDSRFGMCAFLSTSSFEM